MSLSGYFSTKRPRWNASSALMPSSFCIPVNKKKKMHSWLEPQISSIVVNLNQCEYACWWKGMIVNLKLFGGFFKMSPLRIFGKECKHLWVIKEGEPWCVSVHVWMCVWERENACNQCISHLHIVFMFLYSVCHFVSVSSVYVLVLCMSLCLSVSLVFMFLYSVCHFVCQCL